MKVRAKLRSHGNISSTDVKQRFVERNMNRMQGIGSRFLLERAVEYNVGHKGRGGWKIRYKSGLRPREITLLL